MQGPCARETASSWTRVRFREQIEQEEPPFNSYGRVGTEKPHEHAESSSNAATGLHSRAHGGPKYFSCMRRDFLGPCGMFSTVGLESPLTLTGPGAHDKSLPAGEQPAAL